MSIETITFHQVDWKKLHLDAGAASVEMGSSGAFAAMVTDDRFRSARRSLQHA